ncbi:hypothetical protein [Botrimarina sp.]|uniref:hypothetical protein n=1 Tax=Botrimarina sp. TaxID=2795802 RepID=UPI0032EE1351
MVRVLVALLFAAAAAGCGQPEEPQAQPPQGVKAAGAGSTDQKAIAQVAERFVRSVIGGDPAGAADLLTSAAQTRYASDPSILPTMGLETQSVLVGEIRLLNDSEAGVQVLVTETGAAEASELGCLMKREGDLWRVCGLASASDGANPVVINFEAPVAAQPGTQPLVDGASPPDERTATEQTGGAIR